MRTYTLLVSIVVHATVACAVLFSTVLATDELPEPRRTSMFVEVFSSPPPSPPPAPSRPRVVEPASVPSVPVEAPAGVHPESERPALVDISGGAPDGVVAGIVDSGVGGSALAGDPVPPPPVTPPAIVRVGGDVRPPTKIVHVSPIYPAIARSSRVSGVVILEATIDEEGVVRELRVLRSRPLLDQAAIDAVQQWRFTPTLLNGRPVSVLMTVTVSFALD